MFNILCDYSPYVVKNVELDSYLASYLVSDTKMLFQQALYDLCFRNAMAGD